MGLKSKEALAFEKKAREEIQVARDLLKDNHYDAAVSRAYYACFYAIHALLAEQGVEAASHKQTGIEFRRLFIKTGKLDKRYSDILEELSSSRMDADYDAFSVLDQEMTSSLLEQAENFVQTLLD